MILFYKMILTVSILTSQRLLNAMTLPPSLYGVTLKIDRMTSSLFCISAEKPDSEMIGEIIYQSYSPIGTGNYIQSLNVFPDTVKQTGIGTHLMIEAMNHLSSINHETISLICKGTVIPFYQRFGFKALRVPRNDYDMITMIYDPLTTLPPQQCLNRYNRQKHLIQREHPSRL